MCPSIDSMAFKTSFLSQSVYCHYVTPKVKILYGRSRVMARSGDLDMC